MGSLVRYLRNAAFNPPARTQRILPLTFSPNLPLFYGAKKFEEESMPAYDLGLFYPVRIGEVFQKRYQVLRKMGYGANSTVWMCRDLW